MYIYVYVWEGMIDERVYELLCCQFGLANEENAGLRKQVNQLIARLKVIEESNKENSTALVDTINDLKNPSKSSQPRLNITGRKWNL